MAEVLLQNNHEVVIISHGSLLPVYLEKLRSKITYFQADFGETDVLEKALPGCEAVITWHGQRFLNKQEALLRMNCPVTLTAVSV